MNILLSLSFAQTAAPPVPMPVPAPVVPFSAPVLPDVPVPAPVPDPSSNFPPLPDVAQTKPVAAAPVSADPDTLEDIWTSFTGLLTHVSVSNNLVCGVNIRTDIYCSPSSSAFSTAVGPGTWTQVAGTLTKISISGGRACGLDPVGNMYCANDVLHPTWLNVPGIYDEVDIDGERICGIKAGALSCGTFTAFKLALIPGVLTQISISGDSACGVNSSKNVFCTDNLDAPVWVQVAAEANQISLSKGLMCVLSTPLSTKIYCSSYKSSNWVSLPGDFKYVSIDNSRLYGLALDDTVFTGTYFI